MKGRIYIAIEDKFNQLLEPKEAVKWVALIPSLQRIGNIDAKFHLINQAPDTEALRDYLAELRYALIFISYGFEVLAEPMGSKGPDFQITRDGHSVMLECTRFRQIYAGPPELDFTNPNPIASEYGDVTKDMKKAIDKIIDKFQQIEGQNSIIAIWNDDGNLEEDDFHEAIRNIKLDIENGAYSLPSGLLAIIYGSYWINQREQQLFLYDMDNLIEPTNNWLTELQKVNIRMLLGKKFSE